MDGQTMVEIAVLLTVISGTAYLIYRTLSHAATRPQPVRVPRRHR